MKNKFLLYEKNLSLTNNFGQKFTIFIKKIEKAKKWTLKENQKSLQEQLKRTL